MTLIGVPDGLMISGRDNTISWKDVIQAIKDAGIDSVYADTDSLMIYGPSREDIAKLQELDIKFAIFDIKPGVPAGTNYGACKP